MHSCLDLGAVGLRLPSAGVVVHTECEHLHSSHLPVRSILGFLMEVSHIPVRELLAFLSSSLMCSKLLCAGEGGQLFPGMPESQDAPVPLLARVSLSGMLISAQVLTRSWCHLQFVTRSTWWLVLQGLDRAARLGPDTEGALYDF